MGKWLSPNAAKRLANLGFVTKIINNTQVIIPPVVSVPAGSFTMGSDKSVDPQASDDETPQSQITTGAYEIGSFEVTVAEYALAVQAKAVQPPPYSGITWQQQLALPDHPVGNVSWLDVVAYATWLAQVTGDPWRLPTEAEWEKAARGADGRIYPWGNQWDASKANTSESGKGTTTPVGTYPKGASPYGAQDMAGNVLEWCSSLYKPYPYKSNDGRENMSDAIGYRVLRGGVWYLKRSARVAQRGGDWIGYHVNGFGFRLVRGTRAGT